MLSSPGRPFTQQLLSCRVNGGVNCGVNCGVNSSQPGGQGGAREHAREAGSSPWRFPGATPCLDLRRPRPGRATRGARPPQNPRSTAIRRPARASLPAARPGSSKTGATAGAAGRRHDDVGAGARTEPAQALRSALSAATDPGP